MTPAKYVRFWGASVLVAALGAQACGSSELSSRSSGQPGVILVDRAEGRLSLGTILSIHGTYDGCVAVTGAWSIAVAQGAALANTRLTQLRADSHCQVTLTEVVARIGNDPDVTYATAPGIAVGQAYDAASVAAFHAAGNTGTAFYGNARIVPSGQGAPGYDLELSFSDDPDFGENVVDVPAAGTYQVAASGATVAPTSYLLDTDGPSEENPGDDFGFVRSSGVTTVFNAAPLAGTPPISVEVDGYVLSLAPLTADSAFREVEAAYDAASPASDITEPVLGSTLTALLAAPEPDAITAAVIVRAHDIATGVRAFQVILLQFAPSSQCNQGETPGPTCTACAPPLVPSSTGGVCCPVGDDWLGTACGPVG